MARAQGERAAEHAGQLAQPCAGLGVDGDRDRAAMAGGMEQAFAVQVDTVRGPGGEPDPRRLRFSGRCVEVAEVLDRWPGEGYRYLKLRGGDGATYILRHEEAGDRWELVQFIRAGVEG